MTEHKHDLNGSRLAPCPSSPNCVSSDASDAEHGIEPFLLAVEPQKAWSALQEAVGQMPRTKIVKMGDTYLHAEARSRVFRFVDDLELELREEQGIIAVRSASRVGHSDMGVNRRRVETLREVLRSRAVVE